MWIVKAFFAIAGFILGAAIGIVPAQIIVTILASLIPMPPLLILLIAALVVIAIGIVCGYVAQKTMRLFFWRSFNR